MKSARWFFGLILVGAALLVGITGLVLSAMERSP